MTRISTFLILLAALMASAPPAAAQPAERDPQTLDALWLGEQVSGSRLTFEDLDGRVVLAYHWCVS